MSQKNHEPIPMVIPWHCDKCGARGLLECLSSDDVISNALEIALLHATASPNCDDEHGLASDGVIHCARYIRCGEWREAEPTL